MVPTYRIPIANTISGNILSAVAGAFITKAHANESLTISGGGNTEALHGSAGNSLDGVATRIIALGGPGDETFDFRDSPVPVTVLGGGGNDTVFGSEFNDVIIGASGTNKFMGYGGADIIVAGDDASMVDGGEGDDSIIASGAGDTIMGGAGVDYVNKSEADQFMDAEPSDYVLGLQERIAKRRQERLTPRQLDVANVVRRDPIISKSVSTSAPGIKNFELSQDVITEGDSLYALLVTEDEGSWARMTIFVDVTNNGVYNRSTDLKLYQSRGRTKDYRGQLRTSKLDPGSYSIRALLESYDGSSTLSMPLNLTVLEEQVLPTPDLLPAHLDIADGEALLIIGHRNGDVTIPNNELGGPAQIDLYEMTVGTTGNHGFSTTGTESVIALYDSNGNRIGEPQDGGTLQTSLTAGQKYFVAVSGKNGATGTYNLVITGRNQVIEGTIATPPGNYAGTANGTFGAGNAIDYWRIVAPATGTILDVDVTADPGLELWVRVADESNNVIGFADLGRSGAVSYLSNIPVTPGQTYYVTLHGLYGAAGDYSLTTDFYADDVGLPATILTSTALANYEPLIVQADGDVKLEGQQIVSASEFKYFLIAPAYDGEFTIRTTGTTDTLLGVYSGNGANLLAQSDNDGSGMNGQVQLSMIGGDEYWVVVRGSESTTGSFGVEVLGTEQFASSILIGGLSNQGMDTFSLGITNRRQQHFQFTAPIGTSSAQIQVDATDPVSRPLDLVWFIEDSVGNITQVDNGGVNVSEILNSFPINEGETYTITVTSKDRAPGSGQIQIDLSPDTVGNGEFVVNTTISENQSNPRVAMNASGRSVVSWTRNPPQGSSGGDLDDDIYFQIFDTNGQAVGSEIRANANDSFVYQSGSDVGIASDGSFWVSWQDQGDGSTRVRRFNSIGGALTNEINVGFTGVFQSQIAVHANGTFAIVGTTGNQLVGRTYSANGTATSPVRIIDDPAGSKDVLDATVATQLNGGYVVAWTREATDYNIVAQRLDSAGNALGAEIAVAPGTVDQFTPEVESNASGQFVIAYKQNDTDGSGANIYFQRFNSTGTHVSTAEKVNAYTSGTQERAAVEVKDDGGVVVSWTSSGQDGDGKGVYLRQYDASGIPVTASEFLLNEFVASDQERPALATRGDTFFAVWESFGQDGNGDSIIGNRLNLPTPTVQPVIAIQESEGLSNDLIIPFGNTTENTVISGRTVRFENVGTATLTGNLQVTGDGSAAFAFSGSTTLNLNPGEFRDVTITMSTSYRGVFNGQLVVTHNGGTSPNSVVLQGQVSSAADSSEVNDSDETATDLGVVSNIGLTARSIHTSSDVDWYRFTVDSTSEVTVSAIFNHMEGDVDLIAYDSNLGILSVSASVSDNEQLSFFLPAGETAYIFVGANGPASNVYDLTINSLPVNQAPTSVIVTGAPTEIPQSTDTTSRVKVGDIIITDDGLGANNITLAGDDAGLFEVIGNELFLIAGTPLDATANPVLDVTINVDDPAVGGAIDVSTNLSINVTNNPVFAPTHELDFGKVNSPVAPGYTQVLHGDSYNATRGFGWETPLSESYSTSNGSALEQDYHYFRSGSRTFLVDLADGVYDIEVTMGSNLHAFKDIAVLLEGTEVDLVTTDAGEFHVQTYRATVTGGQLDLTLDIRSRTKGALNSLKITPTS